MPSEEEKIRDTILAQLAESIERMGKILCSFKTVNKELKETVGNMGLRS